MKGFVLGLVVGIMTTSVTASAAQPAAPAPTVTPPPTTTATAAPGQDDTQEKLRQMQEQRELERAKPAQITVGELEDLMAELKRLRAVVAASGAAKVATPVRRTMIEVGMTRDEVLLFVKQHPNELAITGNTSEAGGEQVTRSRESVSRVSDRPADPKGTGKSNETEMRERSVMKDKRETITISRLAPTYKTIDVGSGGRTEERQVRSGYQATGKHIRVTLVNDVVTAVSAG